MVHELNRVVCKRLSRWFESIEELAGSDPECALAIFEQGADEDSAEAVRISWVVNEHSEAVAVLLVEPILRAKPDEALIVLNNLSNPCLRQPFGCGETCEANVLPIDNG